MRRSIVVGAVIGAFATLGVPVAANAKPAPPPAQCTGAVSTKKVKSGSANTITANKTKITIDGGAIVNVIGNSNCILGSTGLLLSVTGNNNFVSSGASQVRISGTKDLFKSDGANIVDCGGNKAKLHKNDIAFNCVT